MSPMHRAVCMDVERVKEKDLAKVAASSQEASMSDTIRSSGHLNVGSAQFLDHAAFA